jgi:hypothetical protein
LEEFIISPAIETTGELVKVAVKMLLRTLMKLAYYSDLEQ